jgi:aerobic carbon-monoxide dehydrogenase small subunit
VTDRAGSLRVNGIPTALGAIPHDERLLDTIRWRLGLKGTKEGCRTGDCGACTVLVDGRSTLSCLALTHELDGSSVATIEGPAGADAEVDLARAAFERAGALQCGYCTPGFVMALAGMLKEHGPAAPAAELLDGLQGNLCRCTGYAAIVRAVNGIREEPR